MDSPIFHQSTLLFFCKYLVRGATLARILVISFLMPEALREPVQKLLFFLDLKQWGGFAVANLMYWENDLGQCWLKELSLVGAIPRSVSTMSIFWIADQGNSSPGNLKYSSKSVTAKFREKVALIHHASLNVNIGYRTFTVVAFTKQQILVIKIE